MIFCPEGAVSNELTPNRDKIEMIRRVLFFLWGIQALLAMADIILSFWLCCAQAISAFVLYLAITQLNYCNCVVFIGLSFFNLLTVLCQLIERTSNTTFPPISESSTRLKISLCYLSIMYYSFSLPIIFHAYKHFKHMVYQMLLSQTTCETDSVTRDSLISINGFQQTLTIADLEKRTMDDEDQDFEDMEDEDSDNDEESPERVKNVNSGIIRNIEMGQMYGQKSNGNDNNDDKKDFFDKQNGEGNTNGGSQTLKLEENERNNKNNSIVDGNKKSEDIYRRIEESDAI